ncbi:Di-copper centre-containing protein [Rostrohypoxylon terebratum]|nr:Di-copper centre-containing protein [Rostrohypoxylon terebratum]
MPNIRRLIPWAMFASELVLTALPRFDGHDQRPIPVTGLTTGINNRTGELPTRWDINALEHEGGPRWDLYIQGLAALHNRMETDERSHFSLAGESPVTISTQILGNEIQHIAARYNASHRNSSVYREAAQSFRLPYWDWASNAQLPPSCAVLDVTVTSPQGPLTMRNPLYSYVWPTYPLNQTQFPGSTSWANETTRASDGKSDFSLSTVNANLAAVAGQLKDQVYRTFAYAETYDQMSSVADPEGLSLEAPHNVIHNAVGGSFSSIDITAFDPLFMLHHANVDRLAALWQAAHPGNTYQSQTYASGGLYGTARGENVTAESPVKPFYRTDGKTFHTGISTSSVEAFGYTYPELQSQGSDQSADIASRINSLYGNDYDDTTSMGQDWFVDVAANRSELELPCNIDVHLGEVFAGRVSLLTMPMHGLGYAKVPLQRAIRGLNLNGIGRNALERVLRQQLQVDIVKGNGATIKPKDVSGIRLNLAVVGVVSRGNHSELAKYGNKRVVPISDWFGIG